jgi:hypothetical protein
MRFEKLVGKYYGLTILNVGVVDDELLFEFGAGIKLAIVDRAQLCCESRHMSTDDDLSFYVGAKLAGIRLEGGPDLPDKYGNHETEFLIVDTTKGSFTVVNHNVHNGYYGGFELRAEPRGWRPGLALLDIPFEVPQED